MNRLAPSLVWLAAALAGGNFSLPAQPTTLVAPPADVKADAANAFMGDPKHRINPASFNAPRQIFNLPAPGPAPLTYRPGDSSVEDALQKRKNWTLLTPEQIMGVKTPEQILGLPDASGEDKLSLEEQFLLRESRKPAAGAPSSLASKAPVWHDGSSTPAKKSGAESQPWRTAFANANEKIRPDSVRTLGQLLGNTPAASGNGDPQQQATEWNSVFARPAMPRQTPEQIADMEHFRALMEPNPVPEDNVGPAGRAPVSKPATDPFLERQPAYNPAGNAVRPLADNVARPKGITPLPGIGSPTPAAPARRPDWQAQLPPWLNEGGPPPRDPNRNF